MIFYGTHYLMLHTHTCVCPSVGVCQACWVLLHLCHVCVCACAQGCCRLWNLQSSLPQLTHLALYKS